jgi:putative Holliday junction resolvase
VLGIDVGERRIGLAISDTSAILATPLRALSVSRPAQQGAAAVAREIAVLEGEEDGLTAVVVGLPRSLDGTPHRQTTYVLGFVESLRRYTALPIHLQDERLSSHEAEHRLAQREKSWRRRKARLDAASAAVILQDFLDDQSRSTVGDPGVEGG